MKRLKHIILIILPILLLSSKCADKNKTPNILRGRIMHNCTTPASNVAVSLKANADGANKDIIETTTDENGYFELTYIPKASTYRLYAPYKIMKQIPSEPELDLGNINLGGIVNFVIKLQVNNNSYTENDTLYYYDWNYPENGANHWVKKLAGPFQVGIIDSVINKIFTKYPLAYQSQTTLSIRYYINSNPYQDIEFATPFCTNSFTEAILVIE